MAGMMFRIVLMPVPVPNSSPPRAILVPVPVPVGLLQTPPQRQPWDPENSPDWDKEKTDHSYKKAMPRITRDIKQVLTNPPDGSLVEVDERIDDISVVHALLTGPEDTPYEGGFFHFLLRFPASYPHQPPRVKFLTTGGGTVSFNPNLYPDGKVCINVIGTWGATAWTPAQCLFTVLEAIRNVMNKTPYDNEPNLELPWFGKSDDHRKQYNECIYHETLRVAVCQMMEEKEKLPTELQSKMETMFLEKFDFYMRRIEEKEKEYDGKEMTVNVYGQRHGHFNYKQIRTKLREIKRKLDQRRREKQPASEMDQTEAGMEQLAIEDEQATDVKEEQTADVKELEQPASEVGQTEAGMEQLTIEDEQATDVKEEQTADVKELEQPASEVGQTEAGMEQLAIEDKQATNVKEEQTADVRELEQPASEMGQTEAGMEQLAIEDEQATNVKKEQTADVKELEQPEVEDCPES